MTKRVVVIGAGIVGVSAAVRLLQAGHQVTLIDRGMPGEGTSLGNAGLIATGSIIPASTPGILKKVPGYLRDPLGPLRLRWSYLPKVLPWLYGFIQHSKPAQVARIADGLGTLLHGSLEEHLQLAELTGASEWIRTAPYYFVYRDRNAYEGDQFLWELRQDRGVRFETVSGDQLRRVLPAVNDHYQFAVNLHDHGFVRDPMRLVKAHASYFERAGGTFLNRTVLDIELGERGATRLLTDGEPVEVETLVITAGAWSRWMATKLGAKLPLESERGYHLTIQNSGIELAQPVGAASEKFVVTPMAPGLRIAGTVEFGGLDAGPDPRRFEALLTLVRQFLPGIDTREYTTWMGHRPSLPDSLPVIGQAPHFPNVFFGFGHQHVGLTSGPRTGPIADRPRQWAAAQYRSHTLSARSVLIGAVPRRIDPGYFGSG